MKGKAFAMLVMVVLAGTIFGAVSAKDTSDNSYAAEEEYYPTQLSMATDKIHYNVGEPVIITITNNQDYTIYYTPLDGYNNLIITNVITGEQVVNTGAGLISRYCEVLEPGQSFSITWDQCYIYPGYEYTHTDNQLPEGIYRIHWNGSDAVIDGNEWYAETKIVIGRPGPVLSNIPENQGTANNPNL